MQCRAEARAPAVPASVTHSPPRSCLDFRQQSSHCPSVTAAAQITRPHRPFFQPENCRAIYAQKIQLGNMFKNGIYTMKRQAFFSR